MYRRDLLTAEIQKLAQALAKLMGLKQEGKLDEADQALNEMLGHEFNLPLNELNSYDNTAFESFLLQQNLPAEKLDILSQIFYLKFDPSDQSAVHLSLMHKLLLVYSTLEVKHHVINMINISRQKNVQQYIKENS